MNATVNATTSSSPEDPVPRDWIQAAQGWAWTVSCVGGVGNLVTISSIAHQLYLGRAWRRLYQEDRPGLRQQQQQQQLLQRRRPVVALEGDTLLLLHLSVCDFLYCAVNLPLTALTYDFALGRASREPSKGFCTGAALFRYINALAEWNTLGLLTVERCVDLGRSKGARFFRPRPTVFFIGAIWVGSLLLQMGAITQGQFSYEQRSYKCDMTRPAARIYFYTLESLLPCCLMLTGCFSIIFQIRRNTRKLRASGASQELVGRRFRMMLKSTGLVLALLLLFLLCVIPICVYNVHLMITGENNVPLGIGIFMIYWIQYGVNFLVYAASNASYRTAYRMLFLLVFEGARRLLKGEEPSQGETRSPGAPPGAARPRGRARGALLQEGGPGRHPSSSPRRMRSLPTGAGALPRQKGGFGPESRSPNALSAIGPRFWYSSLSSSGTRSSSSSIVTLESAVMHDADQTAPQQ